jgi:hypothetical protein
MSKILDKLDKLDYKCIKYCNAFFDMFKNYNMVDIKNDCISACTSGKTYSSGTIGQQVGGICYEVIIKKEKKTI